MLYCIVFRGRKGGACARKDAAAATEPATIGGLATTRRTNGMKKGRSKNLASTGGTVTANTPVQQPLAYSSEPSKPPVPPEWQVPDYPGFVIRLPKRGIPLELIVRSAMLEALKASKWVQKDASGLLRIHPRVFNYMMQKYRIGHWKNKP